MKARTILIALAVFNIVAIGLSEVQRRSLVQRLSDIARQQDDRISEVQKSLDMLRFLIESPGPEAKKQIQALAASWLISGKKIGLRFSANPDIPPESKCGASASDGPLDMLLPSQTYEVGYNSTTHKWFGAGPNRHLAENPLTKTCNFLTVTYGPKELNADVTPESGEITLWGARFKLDGSAILWQGRPVGHITFSVR